MNRSLQIRWLAPAALLVAGFFVIPQLAEAANSFYNASGSPAQGAALSSSVMRTEFANIGAGFDKLPALTANTAIVVNGSGTALTNTVGAFALAGNFATTGAFNLTLVQQGNVSLTLPASNDTLIGRATTDTLTNKSISGSANTLSNIGNAALTNSSITVGSSTVSLGGTLSTINGNLTFGGANAYGIPTSITLTNATGLPISTGVSGLGAGVATALATNIGSAGAFVTFNGAGGTPSSLVLTNATGTPSAIGLANGTGLPISTGVSGLGTSVATFLATPSSANLAAAVTDETGTGPLVFSNSPAFVTPSLGAATATTLNATGGITTTSVSGFVNNALAQTISVTVGGISSTNIIQVISGGSAGVQLANGGNSWAAISDETEKNILFPITNGLAKVASLRTVVGTLKSDKTKTRHPFLIAQDVQKVLPEAVMKSNGKTLGLPKGKLLMSYTDVIPLLVSALKDQVEINKKMQRRVATLEAKVH